MIKNTATLKTPATLDLRAEDIAKVADYLTRAGNTAGRKLEERKHSLANDNDSYADRIASRQNDIDGYSENIAENEREIATITERIANLPTHRAITEAEAQADLARLVALPFVKSVKSEEIDGKHYIVITTRPNSLQTTLARKFSRSERWYKVKPYKIALPQYRIRLGTEVHGSHALNDSALALSLADHNDTAHWLDWVSHYNHEPHPHWGTTSVSRDRTDQYRSVCLGEYEGEVSSAFRTSIADGLILFATYLQSAGSDHAYVGTRERWALWLGKAEYNLALIPSPKEIAGAVPDDSDDDEDSTPHCGDDNGTDCEFCEDEECECECHSN